MEQMGTSQQMPPAPPSVERELKKRCRATAAAVTCSVTYNLLHLLK